MTDRVRGFGSLDELFAYMQANEEQANQNLAQAQRELTWGSRFAVFAPQDKLVIFGQCMTEEEALAAERDALRKDSDNPDSEEGRAEVEWNMNRLRESHERGYLYGWHYSVVTPDGELGSTHRFNAWPISTELYAAARRASWVPVMIPMKWLQQLDVAYQAFRDHMLASGK